MVTSSLRLNNFLPTHPESSGMIIQYFLQNVLPPRTSLPIHYWFGVYSSLLNLNERQRPTPSIP
ncbi:hypothetical protein A2U01_0073596, partial [Trifolium medium]|nr:hypothetical protein [Trifolium medium]